MPTTTAAAVVAGQVTLDGHADRPASAARLQALVDNATAVRRLGIVDATGHVAVAGRPDGGVEWHVAGGRLGLRRGPPFAADGADAAHALTLVVAAATEAALGERTAAVRALLDGLLLPPGAALTDDDGTALEVS